MFETENFDWLSIWQKEAEAIGMKLDDIRPIKMVVGGIVSSGHWNMPRHSCLVWVKREVIDKGLLEIHKMTEVNEAFPFVPVGSAGARSTIDHLKERIFLSDAADEVFGVLEIITRASLHEWKNRKGPFVHVDPEGWQDLKSGFNGWAQRLGGLGDDVSLWHYLSACLGPGVEFLNEEDFSKICCSIDDEEDLDSILVDGDEAIRAIVRGHKRVFDEYRLVFVRFEDDAPEEVADGLRVFREEREAEKRKAEEARAAELALKKEIEKQENAEHERNRRELLGPAAKEKEFEKLNWRTISDADLEKLLYEAPMTELAMRFEVSNVAIKKRINKRKLKHPPQGYFLRKEVVARRGGELKNPG